MKISPRWLICGAALFLAPITHAATEIVSNGVVWTLDRDAETGTFLTGDPWVLGPVKITSIKNTLNSPKFQPKPGQNGSMVNPGTNEKQGYDSTLKNYDEALNASLINGKPVSAENPLELKPGSSLVSMVSWLYNSESDAEANIPRFNGGTKAPRPATRSAGILTVLDKKPADGSFRPPYSGSDKTVKFNRSMLDYNKLPQLKPLANSPTVAAQSSAMAKPWVDHVYEFMGGMTHPSEHMPNYGRDMGDVVNDCTFALFVTEGAAGANPDKDKVLANLVQFGIDLTGIADNGGGWPANGGHHLGRKWPILFAGVMLDDAHMKEVGQWKTRFQENEQTFYVTQAEVDLTHGSSWTPDKRAKPVPYETGDIGIAEWGIRHADKPDADNKDWGATYREVNGSVMPGFALAVLLMDLKSAWNHDAFLDYCDRYMKWYQGERGDLKLANVPPPFLIEMWNAYHPKNSPAPAAK